LITAAVGEECNPEVIRYLNRLSDTLFILSRAVDEGPPARAASHRRQVNRTSRHAEDVEQESIELAAEHRRNCRILTA
jgi:hypothetical protein